MFFAYHWKQVPRHRRMACSRQTSHSTVVLLRGTALQSASTCRISNLRCVSSRSCRLPTNFSQPISVNLPISHAGAFTYWVEYDGEEPGTRVKGREGYFNIDPILRTKARTPILKDGIIAQKGASVQSGYVNLPLDGLSILSLVSKWMGTTNSWREYLAESSARGYNMIHWTPLQERGESNSPYSIRNQLVYEPSMFAGGKKDLGSDGGLAKVEELLKIAKDEYGLLSLTDVVLNHTANDSPWLLGHPEAGRPHIILARQHG